jgi:NTP pyrophosphatase (non-canonical NTP hydrolase)
MSFKEVQKEVDDWIKQYKIGYFKPLEILARLTEEVGELARELNHHYGPKKKKENEDIKELADEISDNIFVLVCLANSLNIDLDEAFNKMMHKIKTRDEKRWEKKEEL